MHSFVRLTPVLFYLSVFNIAYPEDSVKQKRGRMFVRMQMKISSRSKMPLAENRAMLVSANVGVLKSRSDTNKYSADARNNLRRDEIYVYELRLVRLITEITAFIAIY